MEVHLIDIMGDDSAIVQAARVSYGQGTKTPSEDTALIRYLMRHWHTTPFEMVELKFRIKCPIFVARQHFRHRTASINELSARYSVVKNEFWIPTQFRGQSAVNKQGSDGVIDDPSMEIYSKYVESCERSFKAYEDLITAGVAREQARAVLPMSTMTEFYWKINLHNLLHYLRLRLDSTAQQEIRELAQMIFALLKSKLPVVAQAFQDFRLDTVTLTGPEISGAQLSRGEHREFEEKKKIIGTINGQHEFQ
jgi:thymidylate synthase (FAD)